MDSKRATIKMRHRYYLAAIIPVILALIIGVASYRVFHVDLSGGVTTPENRSGVTVHLPSNESDAFLYFVMEVNPTDPAASEIVLDGYVRKEEYDGSQPSPVRMLLMGPLSDVSVSCGQGETDPSLIPYPELPSSDQNVVLDAYQTAFPGSIADERESAPPSESSGLERRVVEEWIRDEVSAFGKVSMPFDDHTFEDPFFHADYTCTFDASPLVDRSSAEIVVHSPYIRVGRTNPVTSQDTEVCGVFTVLRGSRTAQRFTSNTSLGSGDYFGCDVSQSQLVSWGTGADIEAADDGDFKYKHRGSEHAIVEDIGLENQRERNLFLLGASIGLAGSLLSAGLIRSLEWFLRLRE